uniref:Uncharacterized protein n=1 Tax=Oryza sativa subsp. japonica TaxID=39947 RepID=Q69MG8_ORYSJ|nr:hypothetical protein [Oryza sativa Japonica Group]
MAWGRRASRPRLVVVPVARSEPFGLRLRMAWSDASDSVLPWLHGENGRCGSVAGSVEATQGLVEAAGSAREVDGGERGVGGGSGLGGECRRSVETPVGQVASGVGEEEATTTRKDVTGLAAPGSVEAAASGSARKAAAPGSVEGVAGVGGGSGLGGDGGGLGERG